MKLRQELDQPLIPVTRNFRPCFRQGPGGVPEIGLCPEKTSAPAPRAPAAQPAPAPAPKLKP